MGRQEEVAAVRVNHRHRNENVTAISRSTLCRTLELLPRATVYVGAKGDLYLNRAARTLLDPQARGLGSTKSLSQRILTRQGESLPPSEQPWTKVLSTQHVVEAELLVDREGIRVPVSLAAGPVSGDNGAAVGAIVVLHEDPAARGDGPDRLLVDATDLLGSALDWPQKLHTVAQLCVQEAADICVIELMDEHGELRCFEVAVKDPSLLDVANKLQALPLPPGLSSFSNESLARRCVVFRRDIDEGWLKSISINPQHFALLQQLQPVELIAAPMMARDHLLGVFILMVRPGRSLEPRDVTRAKELAARAALALDNAQLSKDLQSTAQTRDSVLAMVAHDLRTPLAALLLSARTLLHHQTDSRLDKAALRSMVRAGERMSRMVEDLLDHSLSSHGQLKLRIQPHTPRSLVDEAMEIMAPLAPLGSLTNHVEDTLPLVLADRDRVVRVLVNLIGNSLKFTDAGGYVAVGASTCEEGVRFFVMDNGRGISAQNLPHVFAWSYRAQQDSRGGAGIGLSICKRIVDAHGGRIWVESREGMGSTFYFVLPRDGDQSQRGRVPTVNGDGLLQGDRVETNLVP
jgi:signal transduction histidine kinase